MKNSPLLSILLFANALAGQVTVQDDAKVGVLVTGTGNVINTTQIFGKSPEYAELKKRLDGLQSAIQKKADRCEKYTDPVAKDDCRTELIALNVERDSVQKIEKRFREDVIRLAETFSNIQLNSERLRLAKKFFDDGKISEADNVLKEKDIASAGDAALAAKVRNDSILLQTANEFALKARLKAVRMEYDSAQLLFERSRKYFETVDNLWEFAFLLQEQNQATLAIGYYEKALKLARSAGEEAVFATNLGTMYWKAQKLEEAEKMYLRSLETQERLVNSGQREFEPGLGLTLTHLGAFYAETQKLENSERMHGRALDIYAKLAKADPDQFEPGLARAVLNMGHFYFNTQKMGDAKKMFAGAIELYGRLPKSTDQQYLSEWAISEMNLAIVCQAGHEMAMAELAYLAAQEHTEQLASASPAKFGPNLAWLQMNMGVFYASIPKISEAEKSYARSLETYERLAGSNPAQFKPDLAFLLNNYGNLKMVTGDFSAAKSMFSRALEIRKKELQNGLTRFETELYRTYFNYSALRDSLVVRKDFESTISIQREMAACSESVGHLVKNLAGIAPTNYGMLAWYCLIAHKYPESAAASEKVLALDPVLNWSRTNLGHALLFQNDWPKAQAAYSDYISKEADKPAARKTLETDWDTLEAAGITCPELAQARAWLKEQ